MAEIAWQNEAVFGLQEAPSRARRRPLPTSLRLSPTAVTCFRHCPRQYKFRYVDRLGDEYGGPRPYFTMGNHVHDTLKEFLTAVPLEQRNQETAVRLLRKNWRRYRMGFRDQEDERRWAEKALRQLSSFVASQDIRVRPYMVESRFEEQITPGLVLHGRIDRIDLQPDRTLHIIDYKTGNAPASGDRTQLYLNSMVLSRKTPYPVSKASFIYLSTGLVDTVPIEGAVLDEARWDLLITARTIGSGRGFRPQPGAACRNCDFRPICPERMRRGRVGTAGSSDCACEEVGSLQKALAF